jgi:hypothetical protein
MARPRKQIDPAQVEGLAAIGCTVDEIAAVLDCTARTLQRRFVTHMDRGRGRMRMSLRRLQMKAAENGNAAILIWLGKQILSQRDAVTNYNIDLGRLDDEQLERIAAGEDPNSIASASGTGVETTPPLTSQRVN